MRHLPNGSLLVDELAIVIVFPLESPPALLLTGTGDPADATRVIGSLRGDAIGLIRHALELLGHPVMPADSPGAAQDATDHGDDL